VSIEAPVGNPEGGSLIGTFELDEERLSKWDIFY